MRRRVLDGVGTVVLALILGVIVWVNATYQSDRPREDLFPEPIPVQVLGAPSGSVATNDPVQNVSVRIRAFSSSWATLTADDFSATADWGGLTEGMHPVPIKVACSDRTTTIMSVHPRTAYVRLESIKKELKDVAVELLDRDEVPLGYRVYSPDVDPDLVSVEGPASVVDRVARVAASVSLLNQRASIDRVVELTPVDEDGRPVTGVALSPQAASVRVAIEKKQNYREVAVRARTKGQPARGYFVSGVSVVPATVTVVGPPGIIDTMAGLVDTKDEVDVTSATRMIAERAELDLPVGVSTLGAAEGEPAEVLVTVEIDAVTGGTTVELRLDTRRLQDGLIARPSVSIVDVILVGPSVLLDELQTDLLEAYVDLGGLGVGTHQVKPSVRIVVAQDSKLRDIVVKDISPKYVQVDISPPPTSTPTLTPTATPTWTPTSTPSPTAVITATAPITATGTLTMTSTLVVTGTVQEDTPTPPAEQPEQPTSAEAVSP